MSIDVVRKAAAHMSQSDPFLRAVADWLEEAAEHLEINADLDDLPSGLRECVCPTALEGLDCSVVGQAVTVARIYLGDDS